MREIKFRAKATQDYVTSADAVQEGDWVKGYYYFCRNRTSGIIVTELEAESGGVGSGIVQVEIKVDYETRGEYTGLKDKNGKEIYEGDIVTQDVGKKFKDGSISLTESEKKTFEVKFGKSNLWQGFNLGGYFKYEIIGNIHENPDLLEGK